MNINKTKKIFCAALVTFFVALGVSAYAQDMHTSSQFRGSHANQGHVTHGTRNGKSVLTLSDDFVVPDTPDPHWRVVDAKGNVYDLDKLKKKSLADKYQKEVVLPAYVKNVSKVIIWCAWAEANLGEASFSSPVQ
jgi:hypothetical protein